MTTGAMTRAAAVLGISQPAVTSLIRNLEREIGFALFNRQKGRLTPTPEAEHLYTEVLQALGGFQRISEVARHIRDKNFGTIVVATYPGIAIDFLPTVVSEFLAQRANVRFRLLSRSSYVVRDMIPLSQFDIGVLEGPIDLRAAQAERFVFRCCCVLSDRHPLAAHAVLTPQLLSGDPFVSLYREHMTYGQIAHSFKAAGSHWNVVAETQYFASCCAFAALGDHVSIVHPITAQYHRDRGLAVREFTPAITYELTLVFPPRRPRALVVVEFAELLRHRIAAFCAQ